MKPVTRVLALWCVGWDVSVAAAGAGITEAEPLALMENGRVDQCNRTADALGVRPGHRVRQAQGICPELWTLPADSAAAERAFEELLPAIDEVIPGGEIVEPGCCLLRMRGAARYYGGEGKAAAAVSAAISALWRGEVRIGVADGPFAARLAARYAPEHGVRTVEEGRSADFLSAFDVGELRLEKADFPTDVLHRLGIRTLGRFSALEQEKVRDRFGEQGVLLQERARGRDERGVSPTQLPERYIAEREFDEPLADAESIVRSLHDDLERMGRRLERAAVVTTAVRIVVRFEDGLESERTWGHSRFFTSAEVLDRVRWQLQGDGDARTVADAPVTSVRLEAAVVERRRNHEAGLWEQSTDDRVGHCVSRVQRLMGHTAAGRLVRQGGRLGSERQRFIPWGEADGGAAREALPWPGHLPGLHPSRLLRRDSVAVLDVAGESADVTERGMLRAPLGAVRIQGRSRRIETWSGPWEVRSRWWDTARARHLYRFQAVDEGGEAWLLELESRSWRIAGVYD